MKGGPPIDIVQGNALATPVCQPAISQPESTASSDFKHDDQGSSFQDFFWRNSSMLDNACGTLGAVIMCPEVAE